MRYEPSRKALVMMSIIAATTFLQPAHAGFWDHYGEDLYNTIQGAGKDAGKTINDIREKWTSNRIDGSFEDIYPKPFFQTQAGWFVLVGGSAVLVATVTYFTAGGGLAAAGPISTWVGTQVGMATGVGSGATAAGLAVLGGGTVASGGFGIAGGLAVLAAISDVGIAVALDQAAGAFPDPELARNKYRILKIPLPKKANDAVLADLDAAEELVEKREAAKEGSSETARLSAQIRRRLQSALGKLQHIDPKSATAGYDYITKAVLEYNFMDYRSAWTSILIGEQYVKNQGFTAYVAALIILTQDRDDALEDASKVLNYVTLIDPEAIQPYILQTIVLMDMHKPDAALDKALKGLKHVDDNFELNWRAAEIAFHNVGVYGTSARLYKAALKKVSQNEIKALCKMMVALSYERQKEHKQAREWYSDAIEEISDNPEQVEKMAQLWRNLKG